MSNPKTKVRENLGVITRKYHTLNETVYAKTKLGQAVKSMSARRATKDAIKNGKQAKYEDNAGNTYNTRQVQNKRGLNGEVVTAAKMKGVNGNVTETPRIEKVKAKSPTVVIDKNRKTTSQPKVKGNGLHTNRSKDGCHI